MFAPFLVVLAAGTVPANHCARGVGAMYDELHSYRVTSPEGWCCDSHLRCSRSSEPDSASLLEVRHSCLDLDESLQAAVGNDLHKTAGTAREWVPIDTRQGRRAETWRIQLATGGIELVAYFLEEGVCLVRLSLSSSLAVSPEAEASFQSFVKSYESTPRLPNTSLEPKRGR